jgi:hypothetical protein
MKRNRTLLVGGTFVALLVALAIAQLLLGQAAAQQTGAEAPRFEVDPFWPKPLPNNWVLGQAIGVWADEQDVVWIVHRGSATLADNEKALELKNGECCAAAPPVLAFDANGNLVRSWGGPGQGYDWPSANHGIFVDHLGNVWIGGNGPGDSHLVKFTKDGKFLQQFGRPNARRGPEFRPHRQDLRRAESERGVSRRRIPQQTHCGRRCDERQDEAVLGRVRQQA